MSKNRLVRPDQSIAYASWIWQHTWEGSHQMLHHKTERKLHGMLKQIVQLLLDL